MMPRTIVPPQTAIDQFIVCAVTGTPGGKNENTRAKRVYAIAKRLTKRPYRPRVQGPNSIGSFLMRLATRKTIGRRYEEKKPATTRETAALKATVEPILIRPRKALITLVRAIDQSGIAQFLFIFTRVSRTSS